MFNVFLTIFLFASLIWLSLIGLATFSKLMELEKIVKETQKTQAEITYFIKQILTHNLHKIEENIIASNDIHSVIAKVLSDYLDSMIDAPTTSSQTAPKTSKPKKSTSKTKSEATQKQSEPKVPYTAILREKN